MEVNVNSSDLWCISSTEHCRKKISMRNTLFCPALNREQNEKSQTHCKNIQSFDVTHYICHYFYVFGWRKKNVITFVDRNVELFQEFVFERKRTLWFQSTHNLCESQVAILKMFSCDC